MPEIGQTLSHFRIVEKIGEGGMGEVYLADDTTLDRQVALKFLPEAFTSDPERMARFEREAKLLASLNHSNIAGIYGLEQADGSRFLVLEYVEGETLQARLSKGALPLEDALELCRQIAEGLEAAHEKGVIHRDLKPANVMITSEEKVKILDFGLAKAFSDDTQSIDSSQSPTLTEAMTQPGVILGTAAYMSPEQAKGKSVDKRADIWAFGCILYECLTGKKAFEGETVTETLAAVIKEEPDFGRAPAKTRFVLRQCLAKDRKNRLRDIGDAMAWIGYAPETVEPESLKIKRPWLPWGIAAVCLIGALVLGYLYIGQTHVEAPEMITEISTPATSEPTSFALSPDGRLLVFVATNEGKQQLWMRSFDKMAAQPLIGTEGATFPFWSPDSQKIGFFAEGKLRRIDIEGKRTVPLADAPEGLGGTWNKDNVIVFSPGFGNPLHQVSAVEGGNAVQVTQLDSPSQTSHTFPQFLPDGQHLLHQAYGSDGGLYLTSLKGDESKKLLNSSSPAIYVKHGYLLFLRQGTLFSRPFNAVQGEFVGDLIQIADSLEIDIYGHGAFSASDTGILAFRTASTNTASRSQMVWIGRSGEKIESLGEPVEGLANPELSPDGRQVAVDRDNLGLAGGRLVWLYEVARGVPRKFTSNPGSQIFPVWSQDESHIIFSTGREGSWDLHQMAANGLGNVEILLPSFDPGIYRFANDWSRDERFLLYLSVDPTTGRDLWALPLSDGEGKPFPLVNSRAEEQNGQFSPDTEWIAYQSNESGRFEIYAQPFPGPGTKVSVSTNGGIQPRWHPSGNELYYIALDGNLMAAPIHVNDQNLRVSDPIKLFESKIPRGGYMDIMRIQYDVSNDGFRFLVNQVVDEPSPTPITIITNWIKFLEQ